MKKALRIPAILLYAIAAIILGTYLFLNFNPKVMLPPISRLILLGGICLCSYVGSMLYAKTVCKKESLIKATFVFYFALYIFLLLTLVLYDSFFGRTHSDVLWSCDPTFLKYYLQNSINFIPFKTILEYLEALFINSVATRTVFVNLVGNLFAFVPFGFFALVLLPKQLSLPKFSVIMLTVAIFIEAAQLFFLVGSCDIDDIILNVSGAIISYIIFKSKFGIKLIGFLT